MSRYAAPPHLNGLEIAIIGMAGRFPGAPDLETFWRNLRDGVRSVSTFADEELIASGIPRATFENPSYVRANATLEEIEMFDAAYFDYAPREAELMDPQHRIFLECCSEALQSAGYDSEGCTYLTGVYAGANVNTYFFNLVPELDFAESTGNVHALIGNEKDYLATRVSYKLNLRGPSIAVQTACSTSLVTVHLACRGLLSGECDLALAGGISIRVPQKAGYLYQEGGVHSPDGYCRAFDARALGTTFGSGAGVVVLKRLDQALSDNDHIWAVIKGSAVNNDGSAKVGYTAPSLDGQVAVIRAAHQFAEVQPETINYVEAHATGTPLGDPIEVQALIEAFSGKAVAPGSCALGSVKTNFGHLVTAAGIASLIKTVLALHHRQIPPTLNFEHPNPQIDFANSPFYVNTNLRQWPANSLPRRAGVSSFGVGGTNAHVVLEEPPPALPPLAPIRSWQLIPLSARTESALQTATSRLASALSAHCSDALPDIAFTLQVGRRTFSHRRVLICRSTSEARQILESRDAAHLVTGFHDGSRRPLAFFFGGNASQPARILQELYQTEPGFRAQMDRCFGILKSRGLASEQYPQEQLQARLAEAELFIAEYSLAQLLWSWGVIPDSMIGQGVGEYVAAVLAGVLSVEDALDLVFTRGRLIESLSSGELPNAGFHQFLEQVRRIRLHPPQLPYFSDVTGDWITPQEATSPEYWVSHLRHTVPSARGLEMLVRDPHRILLEIGPGQTLRSFVEAQHARSPDQLVLDTLPCPPDRRSPQEVLLQTLAQLWVTGVPVNWNEFASIENRGRIPLPAHPFERQRYWIEPKSLPQSAGSTELPADQVPVFSIPSWKRSVPPPPGLPGGLDASRKWIVFADASGFASTLTALLRESGQTVIEVIPGERFERRTGNSFVINARARADYSALLAAVADSGEMPDSLLHAWSIIGNPARARSPEYREQCVYQGFYSLLFLAQAFDERQYRDRVDIAILADHLYDIAGETVSVPETATILGAANSIPLEYPNLRCRVIDLSLAKGSSEYRSIAARILAECLSGRTDRVVAYRGSDRFVPVFEPVEPPIPPSTPSMLRDAGVYVITGGFGGIGLLLAEYLSKTRRAKLALIGRTPIPDREGWEEWLAGHSANDSVSRKIRALRKIEQLGGSVLPIAADVSDLSQTEKAIARILEYFGAIHGVFHAAGTVQGGLIQSKTETEVSNVLAPKLRGTRVLETVLGNIPIDFLMLFSSTLSLTGSIGKIDYCAANAFLDSFARSSYADSSPRVLSVNWDGWRGIGMNAAPGEMRGSTQPVLLDHPLLRECLQTDAHRAEFLSELDVSRDWVLAEHTVGAVPALPGTALLEIARAAFSHFHPGAPFEFRDVYFLAPALADSGAVLALRTVLTQGSGLFEFRILDARPSPASNRPTEYARGKIAPAQQKQLNTSISDIKARCPREVAVTGEQTADGDHFVRWGARWKNLRRVYAGDQQALALLQLPDQFSADLPAFHLHPALLDVATAFLALISGWDDYVPVAYGSLIAYGPLPKALYAHARRKGGSAAQDRRITFDVSVLDLEGNVVVQIQDLLMIHDSALSAVLSNAESEADSAAPQRDYPLPDRPLSQERDADEIFPETAMEALESILSMSPVSQVVISAGDINTRIERAKEFTLNRILQDAGDFTPQSAGHARPSLQTAYLAPASETEMKVVKIWQQALGVEQIGVNDDFFDLGGHSLLGAHIVDRLRQVFAIELPFSMLIEATTVAQMAAHIDNLRLERDRRDQLEILNRLRNLSEEDVEKELSKYASR